MCITAQGNTSFFHKHSMYVFPKGSRSEAFLARMYPKKLGEKIRLANPCFFNKALFYRMYSNTKVEESDFKVAKLIRTRH